VGGNGRAVRSEEGDNVSRDLVKVFHSARKAKRKKKPGKRFPLFLKKEKKGLLRYEKGLGEKTVRKRKKKQKMSSVGEQGTVFFLCPEEQKWEKSFRGRPLSLHREAKQREKWKGARQGEGQWLGVSTKTRSKAERGEKASGKGGDAEVNRKAGRARSYAAIWKQKQGRKREEGAARPSQKRRALTTAVGDKINH